MAREGLTPKQEAFAQGVADGKTLSDAYRAAYDASRTKPEVIWVKAAELMADGRVSVRVESLRAKLAEKTIWTREDSVRTLLRNLDDPEAKVADKNATVKILNEMHGFNAPQKHEVGGGLLIHVRYDND